MSYGMAAYGADGKITFHSDYSSVVYAGELSKNTDPARPVYTGDHHIAMSSGTKTANYEMGWIIQYKITLDSNYMIPFYKPVFDGQEIGIMDVVNEGTTWVVNLLYSGHESQWPYLYAFAPLTELPSSAVTSNDYGIEVYDANSDLVFTDSVKPLRVDDVILVSHPTLIKTGNRGSCGNSGTCHVNYTSDQSNTHTGANNNTTSKLYHIVPSAYGGLAFENSGSGSNNCGLLNLGRRKFAWSYKSWASFRGTVKHPRGGAKHVAGWQSDFAGAAHQYAQGSCGVGGFLGALLGIFLVVFTGGAALALVGGALAGFALGELTVGTSPSLKAYDTDATFDTSNPVNLLVTDTSYYGIADTGDKTPAYDFYFYKATDGFVPSLYWSTSTGLYSTDQLFVTYHPYFAVFGGYFEATSPSPAGALDLETVTYNGITFIRGPLQETEVVGSLTTKYYSVAIG
jgi:hypothetical protein